MRITKVQLTNFRNYVDDGFEPDAGMNILVGPNGQGKSAVLEAAYVLATSKSHRTARDSDLIRIGSDWARVRADVDRELRPEASIEITLARNEKKVVRINRVKHDRVGDIVGQLNVVIFSTADVDMVKSDPSHRRRFLNLEISQVSPQYVYALGRYKRVLEQRNSFLKEIRSLTRDGAALDIWDEQLVEYGSIMVEKRLVFLRRLSELAEPLYNQLAGGSENLGIEYEPKVALDSPRSLDDVRGSFRRDLEVAREADFARRTTTRGPHRDDVLLRVNGLDVRAYGSQGQQRSAALALKLAEIDLIEQMVGEPPVALLDDVTSELDEERRAQVFDLTLGRCQTLVTTTSLAELPRDMVSQSVLFTVASGRVEKA